MDGINQLHVLFVFQEFLGKKRVFDSLTQNDEHPYETTLELTNVTYRYVGYYYCVKNSSDPDDSLEVLLENEQASRIYLFVEGMLIVEVRSKTWKIEKNILNNFL